ncbi:MAG: hypothetical protein GY808_16045 [Gammaproteobacteria bacterium]|nr:hypothetical protein [Gammaproteobacteria bacterium]
MKKIQGVPGCYWGPVPYRGPGYSEGGAVSINTFLPDPVLFFAEAGSEIVYDFAKLKRARFRYTGNYISDSLWGFSLANYVSEIEGLRSWEDTIYADYGGDAYAFSIGIGANIGIDFGVSAGYTGFSSLPDITVGGKGFYLGIGGFSVDGGPSGEVSLSYVEYVQDPQNSAQYNYFKNNEASVGLLVNHIMQGNNSPWNDYGGSSLFNLAWPIAKQFSPIDRERAVQMAVKYAFVKESMQLGYIPK